MQQFDTVKIFYLTPWRQIVNFQSSTTVVTSSISIKKINFID